MIGRMELEKLPRCWGAWEGFERGCRKLFRGLSDRQIEEMLNDNIYRKLRLEWAEGVCDDLVNEEWQDGGVIL